MQQILNICKNQVCFKVNGNPYFNFWEYSFKKDWEQATFNIFDKFLNENANYLDIGAWIGPTVLYGAHKAKHVYSIEPDPVAYKELTYNLQLNQDTIRNVTCINSALTPDSQVYRLYIKSKYGDSETSLIPSNSIEDFIEVSGITITDLINTYNIKDINFIKMDIEAGEYYIIPSMKLFLESQRPTLYLSLHPPKIKKEKDLIYLTQRLIDNLDFYTYIYDVDGNRINSRQFLSERNFNSFIFTDEPW